MSRIILQDIRAVAACRLTVRLLMVFGILLLGVSCASNRVYIAETHQDWEAMEPPPASERTYQAFLLGDIGRFDHAMDLPVLRMLRKDLEAADSNAAVIFLGDNLYCCGLPDSTAPEYVEEERRLIELLKVVEGVQATPIVVPGNHDWNNGRAGGLESVRRQERLIEQYLDRGNVFLPDMGFPGPAEVALSEDITLVALDTQWWLHAHERPLGEAHGYELTEEADFLLQLDDVLRRNRRKIVILAAHHPLRSSGVHGGYSPPREHLFPLTAWRDRAYIPLPVLGSLFVAAKHLVGGRQDLHGRRYTALRRFLERSIAEHERLVYASGHDHTLQHFDAGEQQHLISGTGALPEYVSTGGQVTFASDLPGLITLQHFRDGSLWMEIWEAVGDGSERRLLFRHRMFEGEPTIPDVVAAVSASNHYRRELAANPRYVAGPFKQMVFGRQNRRAWGTPVDAPRLDLGSEAGGLTPLRRGGGMQTASLRLQGGDGRIYALRSVDKDPMRSLPPALHETVARDLLQDAISSLHPYGAIVAARLSDAAGVLHTRPRLVYVPDDPRLGPYRETFGDRLMLLELRPDDAMPDLIPDCEAHVVGSATLYRRIEDDNDDRVDQESFARARLIDMLISDWDRHSDQWRWARCQSGNARIYRPIAMDRDWAFNQMNGVFPSLIPLVMPKFQDFDRQYGSIRGLTINGLSQDRRFLNALSREDWQRIAADVTGALSDEVIDEAVAAWPQSIQTIDAERTARLLRHRRDRLAAVADRFYRLHARVVDVVGSNMHERFEVRHLGPDETEVVVTKINRDGVAREEIYRRVFRRSETREIRLYGLSGRDEFLFSGDDRPRIRVRAIGGGGQDQFVDAGSGSRARWYDSGTGDTFAPARATRLHVGPNPLLNEYDPRFAWDMNLPIIAFGYNRDEGVLLGGGVKMVRHGFRKEPYGSVQRIQAAFGTTGGAVNARYEGHFRTVLGPWDLRIRADIRAPNSFKNFFGLGNETTDSEGDASYYRARLRQLHLEPGIQRRLGPRIRINLAPAVHYSRIDDEAGRFVSVPQPGVSEDVFRDQWLGGATLQLAFDDRDDRVAPAHGARWRVRSELWQGLRNADDSYAHVSSDLSLFTSITRVPLSLALRIGGAHNEGTFPFYRANELGGGSNLRGYRSTRFAGRTSAYQNTEIRLKFADVSTYVARGDLGLHVFHDVGRVWTDEEHSKRWHRGYGAGLWTRLFDQFVLTATYDRSREDQGLAVALGFFY